MAYSASSMNIGLYQSAASLSALERWQDAVSQNITSGQVTGYRKRTVNFSTDQAGELHLDPKAKLGRDDGVPMLFPRVEGGINFVSAEAQPTRNELDVAIMGDGFFEVRQEDGSKSYTRSGQFRMRPDRTLVNGHGFEVMSADGNPITLLPGQGPVIINADGRISQGAAQLGRLSVVDFPDKSVLRPLDGGLFAIPEGMEPEQVEEVSVQQGYLEGSNVAALREMVDLVLISRAYEANQRMISSFDQRMQKALDALG